MATNEKDTVYPDSKETGDAIPSFLEPNEDIELVYGVNEKALVRKLDFKLLPPLTLLYLLSFLDRSNGSDHTSSLESVNGLRCPKLPMRESRGWSRTCT